MGLDLTTHKPPLRRGPSFAPRRRRPDSSPEGASRLRDSAGFQPVFAALRRTRAPAPRQGVLYHRASIGRNESWLVSCCSAPTGSARTARGARRADPSRGRPGLPTCILFHVRRCWMGLSSGDAGPAVGLGPVRARSSYSTRPLRIAIATACARSFAPSFSKIRSRCVFTVWGEIPRSCATSFVVAP